MSNLLFLVKITFYFLLVSPLSNCYVNKYYSCQSVLEVISYFSSFFTKIISLKTENWLNDFSNYNEAHYLKNRII